MSLEARQPTEYEVKAAFLFNFAKFVEWPPKTYPNPGAPLVVGIVGEDPFGEALTQITQGQTANGRPIEIRHFNADDACEGCHLLFLSRSVAAQTQAILSRLRDRAVVTVSDTEEFTQQGGVIGFVLVGNTVRFDVNLRAAEAVRLKLSSKLLAVARSVQRSL